MRSAMHMYLEVNRLLYVISDILNIFMHVFLATTCMYSTVDNVCCGGPLGKFVIEGALILECSLFLLGSFHMLHGVHVSSYMQYYSCCCLPNHVTVVVLVCVILVCGRDHSLCQVIGAATCIYMYTDCILASAL